MMSAAESLLTSSDELPRLVIISVGGILLLSIGFLFAATALRFRVERLMHRRKRNEAAWEPLILEYLSESGEPYSIHMRVRKRDRLQFIELAVQYVFFISGLYQDRLLALVQPYLSYFAERLRHRDPLVRAEAVHVIGLLGSIGFRDHLITALADPSPMVAMAAVRGLARSKGDVPREVLAVVHRFDNWGPNFVATVLISFGPRAAPALLAHYLDENATSRSRVAAAEALRWMGVADAAPAASDILSQPCDLEVAAASLRLLRRVGWSDHAPLVRMLCRADDSVVRLHAIAALAQLGDKEDVPVLVNAMSDPSRWVALRAARGLHELGAYRTLEELAHSSGSTSLLARQMLSMKA